MNEQMLSDAAAEGETAIRSTVSRRSEPNRILRWYGGFLLLAAALALSTRLQSQRWNEWGLGIGNAVRVGAFLSVGYVALVTMRVMYLEARSIPELWNGLKRHLWNRDALERVSGAPVLLSGLVVMLSGYSTWKPNVVQLNAETFDTVFAAIDRTLHFGPPWRWTHAVFAQWTPLLDNLYARWYVILLGTVLVVSIARPLDERARFFWALGLLYVIAGTILAMLLASGGPVYYAELTGGREFLELIQTLDGTLAREIQQTLWSRHLDPSYAVPIPGISAMPSLHVGVVALLTLWGWGVRRWVGIGYGVYGALIAIGSVHLGWHYAIDGYVGALTAGGCWFTARKVVGVSANPPEAVARDGR